MTPDRLELLLRRAESGEATASELRELEGGLEARWEGAALLREALEPAEDAAFADGVLARLGLDDAGAALREALRVEEAPELADAVLGAAALADPTPALRELLREALDPGPVDLADAVFAAIAPEEARLSAFADGELPAAERAALAARLDPASREALAAWAALSAALPEAVRAAAGPAPALWPAVAARLGVDPEEVPGWDPALLREAVTAAAGPVDLADAVLARLPVTDPRPEPAREPAQPFWRRLLPQVALPAMGLAAAAALLLAFPALPRLEDREDLSFRLSPVNHADIEELSADGDTVVQILQFDAGAPTIIFIDEGPTGDEGATL